MTRKDYERTARILRNGVAEDGERKRLAMAFANWFEEENERFSRDRFMSAVFVCSDYEYEDWLHAVRVGFLRDERGG